MERIGLDLRDFLYYFVTVYLENLNIFEDTPFSAFGATISVLYSKPFQKRSK